MEVKEIVTAEKIALMKNFKLKVLCKKAQAKYPDMKSFDTRDNSSMREALWSLSMSDLASIVQEIN